MHYYFASERRRRST